MVKAAVIAEVGRLEIRDFESPKVADDAMLVKIVAIPVHVSFFTN